MEEKDIYPLLFFFQLLFAKWFCVGICLIFVAVVIISCLEKVIKRLIKRYQTSDASPQRDGGPMNSQLNDEGKSFVGIPQLFSLSQ